MVRDHPFTIGLQVSIYHMADLFSPPIFIVKLNRPLSHWLDLSVSKRILATFFCYVCLWFYECAAIGILLYSRFRVAKGSLSTHPPELAFDTAFPVSFSCLRYHLYMVGIQIPPCISFRIQNQIRIWPLETHIWKDGVSNYELGIFWIYKLKSFT